jgi:hypothetical protein
MKYFTPELVAGFQSPDEDGFVEAHEEWERAIQRYHRRLAKIKARLPKGVQQFRENHVCLHDAQLLRMARRGDSLVMVLETEPPARDLVVLTFVLNGEPEIDRSALQGYDESNPAYWLYEEWDVARSGQCSFEVLLSNGWSVKLAVRNFHFVIGHRILPSGNEMAEQTSKEVIPRSA